MNAVAVAIAISLALLAPGDGSMPIDPRVVLKDLAEPYREAPQVDDMRITVKAATGTRIERMTVRTRPGEGAELAFGPLTIWTDLESWYATHRDIADAFVRIPIGDGDALGVLSESFPILVIPQIVWMLSDDPDAELCTHTGAITWTSGSIRSAVGPNGELELGAAIGTAGGRSIELRMDAQGLFGVFEVIDEKSRLTIIAERLESHAPDKDSLGVDTIGREALPTLESLLDRVREAPE